MKWLDDMKEAGAAFKEWGRALTIIGAVMAGALVVGLTGIVVAVAPFVLGAASVIFIVLGGAYALGKAIREGWK